MAPEYPGFLIEIADGVATVWIDRPEKRNAVNAAMWRSLPELLDGLAEDPDVRVMVLRGSGTHFSAGADLRDLEQITSVRESTGISLTATAEHALATFPKPTVAAVKGYCLGGGCSLAVACDLRVASDTALFAIPAARHGVRYPAGPLRRLASLVGGSEALRLLYTAERIDAARALRIGLVNEVVAETEFEGQVLALVELIARGSTETQLAAKAELIDR